MFEVHELEDVGGDVTAGVAGHVPLSEDRIELDGVQVDDLAGVAGVGQPRSEALEDAMAER